MAFVNSLYSMRFKMLLGVFVVAQVFICLSDELNAESISRTRFLEAVTDASTAISGGKSSESYENTILKCADSTKTLEALLNAEMIQFAWDRWQYEGEPTNSVHISKADELERMRQVIDYQLKEMILIERLKDLNEKKMQMKNASTNAVEICSDYDEFIDMLEDSEAIGFQIFINDSPSRYIEKSITSNDKVFSDVCNVFSSAELVYNPLRCETIYFNAPYGDPLPSANMIITTKSFRCDYMRVIVDKAHYISVREGSIVVCKDKAYDVKQDNLQYKIEKILEGDESMGECSDQNSKTPAHN